MTIYQTRDLSCKDEELPIFCGYSAFNLERDLAYFKAYSPKLHQYS